MTPSYQEFQAKNLNQWLIMKNVKSIFQAIIFVTISFANLAQPVPGADSANPNLNDKAANDDAESLRQLIIKYDRNANGKIDVEERKGYVKELAHLRRAQLLRHSQEAFIKADVNADGKIDKNERIAFGADQEAIRRAKQAASGTQYKKRPAGPQSSATKN
jgi:hypothetical protein